MSYSIHIIEGNAGGNAELRYTESGIAVASFSVAANYGKAEKATTTWYKVTCWRERAEFAAQYVKRGVRVLVEGHDLRVSLYTKNNTPAASLELTADRLELLQPIEKPEQVSEAERLSF